MIIRLVHLIALSFLIGILFLISVSEARGVFTAYGQSMVLSEAKSRECPGPIQLTGNNPQPSSILCLICIHDVTLGSGHFTVTAENTLGVTFSFSGDWLSRMPLCQVPLAFSLKFCCWGHLDL